MVSKQSTVNQLPPLQMIQTFHTQNSNKETVEILENIHSEIILQRNSQNNSPFRKFMADVEKRVDRKKSVLLNGQKA